MLLELLLLLVLLAWMLGNTQSTRTAFALWDDLGLRFGCAPAFAMGYAFHLPDESSRGESLRFWMLRLSPGHFDTVYCGAVCLSFWRISPHRAYGSHDGPLSLASSSSIERRGWSWLS